MGADLAEEMAGTWFNRWWSLWLISDLSRSSLSCCRVSPEYGW